MINSRNISARYFPIFISTFSLLTATGATALGQSVCASIHHASEQEDTVRSLDSISDCYDITLESDGALSLDLSVDPTLDHAAGQVMLSRLQYVDRPSSATSAVWRTAREMLTILESGTYRVRVQTARGEVPLHRIDSRFTPIHDLARDLCARSEKSETNGELEIEGEELTWHDERPWKSETNGELEIEGEESRWNAFCDAWAKSETNGELEIEGEELTWHDERPWKSETNGELEIEGEELTWHDERPWKSETNGELEIEGEELRAGLETADWLQAWCGTPTEDDHHHRLLCASQLDDERKGELADGDRDVFRFEIESWQLVEIEAAGSAELQVSLLDALGHELVSDDGLESSARLTRALGPGVWYLRVEGQAGSFRLSRKALH